MNNTSLNLKNNSINIVKENQNFNIIVKSKIYTKHKNTDDNYINYSYINIKINFDILF